MLSDTFAVDVVLAELLELAELLGLELAPDPAPDEEVGAAVVPQAAASSPQAAICAHRVAIPW
jgi:hypothetical protein